MVGLTGATVHPHPNPSARNDHGQPHISLCAQGGRAEAACHAALWGYLPRHRHVCVSYMDLSDLCRVLQQLMIQDQVIRRPAILPHYARYGIRHGLPPGRARPRGSLRKSYRPHMDSQLIVRTQ